MGNIFSCVNHREDKKNDTNLKTEIVENRYQYKKDVNEDFHDFLHISIA